MEYPKITNVKVLEDFWLEVTFENNVVKQYDCKPLFIKTSFEPLMNINFFKLAEKSTDPYGVVWNDDIDLAESEIWINGKEIKLRHVV